MSCALVGPLKLSYSQFEELESFAKFRSHLDAETERQLRRGRTIRSVLQQKQFRPVPVADQFAVLFATTEGLFDKVADADREKAADVAVQAFKAHHKDVIEDILKREKLSAEVKAQINATIKDALVQAGLVKA